MSEILTAQLYLYLCQQCHLLLELAYDGTVPVREGPQDCPKCGKPAQSIGEVHSTSYRLVCRPKGIPLLEHDAEQAPLFAAGNNSFKSE